MEVLDTKSFVRHFGTKLQAYSDAATEGDREAAVGSALDIFEQFERAKTGAFDPTSPGARLGVDKLDSLARKYAKTTPFQTHRDVAAAFAQQVSPALGARLGLVGDITEELRRAKEAHQAARSALHNATAQAALIATAHDSLQQAAAEAERVSAALIASSTQQATAQAEEIWSDAQHEVTVLREERDALREECNAIKQQRQAILSSVPYQGVIFEAGGVRWHLSKEALQKSRYLAALASGAWQEQPNRAGELKISDITSDELRAVTEFLEEDEISDLRAFGPERLLKVAMRFGSDEMIAYVKDAGAYREQQRLARAAERVGATPIPPGYRLIPAGTFTMGSPPEEVERYVDEIQREVRITRPFFLKETPVTQQEWMRLMGYNPSYHQSGDFWSLRPVERVSWYEALAYCNALSREEGLEECYDLSELEDFPPFEDAEDDTHVFFRRGANGYHLPTEAQWEYAARGDGTSPAVDDIAWWKGNGSQTTHGVGQKAANSWGLCDMLGNVEEWVWDCVRPYYDQISGVAEDPEGSEGGVMRGCRGGCYDSPVRDLRAAVRFYRSPDHRSKEVGFRPARSLH